MKIGKNIRFLSAALLVSFAFSLLSFEVFADEEILISPSESGSTSSLSLQECIAPDVEILDFGELAEGGRSYTQSFLLKNSCDKELTVVTKVQTYDGEVEINNGYKVADEWLTFVGGKTDYTVPAGGETIVKLRVFLPNSVKGASYYTSVGLKLKDSQNVDDVEVVDVRMDVLSDGFLRSGVLVSNYAQALGFGGKVKSGVKLKNTGTGGFLSKYTLKRGSVFGSGDFEMIAEDAKEVPAGVDVEFYGGNYTENQYGIYKVQQSITYVNSDGDAMESVLEQTVINLPLVLVFVAGGAFIALISLIVVVKIMKHRKKSEKEDSGKESDNEL